MREEIKLPTIYLWQDDQAGVITAAFNYHGEKYGYSFDIDKNVVRNNMNKKKLFKTVQEALDILVHHGKAAMDRKGNFIPKKVEDAEYRRRVFDPLWGKQVEAFQKAVVKKEISPEEAHKLQLT